MPNSLDLAKQARMAADLLRTATQEVLRAEERLRVALGTLGPVPGHEHRPAAAQLAEAAIAVGAARERLAMVLQAIERRWEAMS